MNYFKIVLTALILTIFSASVFSAIPTNFNITTNSPVNLGEEITFTGTWNYTDTNSGKMFVCKTTLGDYNHTGCGENNEWCYWSGSLDTNSGNCLYTTTESGIKQYTAFVCENNGECSGIHSSNFTVNSVNSPPTITADFNVSYAKEGTHVKLTVIPAYEGEDDLNVFCSESMQKLVDGEYDLNFIKISPPSNQIHEFIAGTGDETKYAYCKAVVSDTNSSVVIASYLLDNIPPSAPSISCGTVTSNSITINWSGASDSGSGIKHYSVYYSSNNDFSNSVFDGNVTGTTKTISDLNLGTYYFKVKTTDNAGNESVLSSQVSCSTSLGDAPTNLSISSSTHSHNVWSNNNSPNFSWSATGTVTNYYYCWSTDSNCDPTINLGTATSKTDINNQASNIYYFRLKACNESNCSSISSFTTKIDTVSPGQVSNFTLNNSNGGIKLSWDAPSDASGISEYRIYRGNNLNNKCDDSVVRTWVIDGDLEEYLDKDSVLNEGQAYYYWIRAYDGAGNSGQLFPLCTSSGKKINFTDTAVCSLSFNLIKPNSFISIGEQEINISISGGSINSGTLRVRKNGVLQPGSLLNQNNKTSLSKIFDFDSEGEYTISVTGNGPNGNYCNESFKVIVDETNPLIEWINPKVNQEIELNQIELKVKAEDEISGIKNVSFYVKKLNEWNELASITESTNNEFSYSWNTDMYGEIELKAIVKDNAGNESEKIIEFIILQEIEETWNYLKEEINEMLLNAGLNEETALKAEKLINEMNPEMKLKAVKNNENYEVLIEISFTPETKNNVQIITVIPKSVVENALLIESNIDFEIIKENPIIKFSFNDLPQGKTHKFSFTIAKNLTEENAKKVIETTLNDLIVPPIILSTEINAENIFIEEPETNWLLIIGIIAIILILLFMGLGILGTGGYMVHRYKKKEGKKMNSNGIHSAYSNKKSSGITKKIKKIFSSEKETEKPKNGKFAFKD